MFRGARRSDLDAIMQIYARARQEMAASGNPTQWGTSFPPQDLIEEDIDTNRLFVYLHNGEMEAVFAFVLGPDPTYAKIEDGQWLNDALPYGTIHRLASAGKRPGVATDVINWCLEHCESLRADTHADNKIMQHLLERTASPAAASSMWPMERPASPTSACRGRGWHDERSAERSRCRPAAGDDRRFAAAGAEEERGRAGAARQALRCRCGRLLYGGADPLP